MENMKPCLQYPCPNFATWKGRCKEHQLGAFVYNNRSARLPKDWPYRQRYVLHRDDYVCYRCKRKNASQVDHIEVGDNHDLSNLAAICEECHRAKTAQEGNDARWAETRQQKIDTWQEMFLQMEEEKRKNNG